MATVLCVDGDRYLTDLLRYALVREGYATQLAHTGRDGLALIAAQRVDLVVLDANLPDMTGLTALKMLRDCSQVPVVITMAHPREEDMIACFRQGADDVVPKPFGVQVLVNHVKAVLRRTLYAPGRSSNGNAMHLDRVTVFDPDLNIIVSYNQRVKLTPRESHILRLLLAHEGQALTAEDILERIWGYDSPCDVNVIRTHIYHLRQKISRFPGGQQLIRTVPGGGYMVHASAYQPGNAAGAAGA